MDFLRQLYEQFARVWRSLSLQQRILVGVGFAIALAGLLSLTFWQTKPQHSLLFSNLQQRDAGEIVEKLKASNIPYKLSDDGTSISIPASQVAETRLALAQEGLPRGSGVGYEIFDRTRLGITSFEQKVNLKRATEGELARTIDQLEEVEWSRVQIVTPEERLFTEQQREPTASVFLNMVPEKKLTRKQVAGIQHLIASSVEGLKPGNITIIDQHANSLTALPELYGASTELSASQFDLRSRVERYFYGKVQAMFDRIVGPGKSAISVSVDLDFDNIERTEEKYDPEGQVVRSEQRQKESTTSTSSQPEGIAGVTSNLPAQPSISTASIGGQGRQASSSITNYEISKSVEHIIESPSSIKGVSVAVVVDGTYKWVTAADGKSTRQYVARSDEEIEKYRRMVVAAVGNPTAKNVEVINVPLESTEAEYQEAVAAQAAQRREFYLTIAKTAATVAVLVIIFLLVRYVLRRMFPGVVPPELVEEAEEKIGRRIDLTAKESEEAEEPEHVKFEEAEKPVELGKPVEPEEKEADLTADLKEMAEKRPEDAAAVMKIWLKEEK
jgi:flagellar M-ring protein FliF